MPNIMINEACNLRCPYCFAEEFVNHSPKEMTVEDFETAINFAMSDREDRQLGIIGGEPLFHSRLNEIMRIAVNDPRTEIVMIYTNAVELDRLAPEILESPKFRMLVNCNSPEDMGEAAFEKMVENMLRFKNEHSGGRRFRLSVNIYKPDFDFSYVIPLTNLLEFDVIRLSISVPQKGDLGGLSPLEYFEQMKPLAIKFVGTMIRCSVITGFDCNFVPNCVFTKEEREGMLNAKDVLEKGMPIKYSQASWARSIFCEINNCSPVIDILPDLRAIRCFGLSEHTKQDIRDFRDITELRNHYISTVDAPACRVWTEDRCAECWDREGGDCSCGCLLFKADQIFNK